MSNEALAVSRKLDRYPGRVTCFRYRQGFPVGAHEHGAAGSHEWSDVYVVTLDKSQPLAVWRKAVVCGPFARVVSLNLLAIEISGKEAPVVSILLRFDR